MHLTHPAGSCEAHAVGHDGRELDVKEQDRVQEHPNDRQKDGQQAVVVLARCVAQHERLVRVSVGNIIAHLRCDDDLADDDEVEDVAKLRTRGGSKGRAGTKVEGGVGAYDRIGQRRAKK